MKTRTCLVGACAAIVLGALGAPARAQNVTTYHNDNARTGQFTQETLLTPANVNSTQFGKLFTSLVDGWVYAQPLYLANVSIGGSTHNVLYVVTQNDTLYAIDADNGTVYWHLGLIPASGTTVSGANDLQGCTDIVPEIGVTGTPVIDTTTGTIYLVAKSKVGNNFFQYLHAIDVSTAAEKFGGPVNIQASVPGTATDGNGTTLNFSARNENQRPALLLENGHVVIGWSSHCDILPWHGWVMSYSASTLLPEGVYNTSPNGSYNGVWMSGGGLAADAGGNIYFATGNGTWNGTTDLGDSIVKLGPPSGGSFPLVDYFTPYNQASLASNDEDLASGGLLLLPPLANGKQLLTQMAKEGTFYLVDTGKMGKYCVNQTPACSNSDPNIVQEVPHATVGVWGSPAFWNGTVYWGAASDSSGAPDSVKAFSFNANNSGVLSTTPISKTAHTFGFSAPTPAISANGTSAGILWGVDNSTFDSACSGGSNCQVLYAYDATNLATMLYNSSQAANLRDIPGGGAVKFATPIIANGKVYFGSQFAVSGFGLLSTMPITATVTLNPAPGNYATTQSVTLSDTTPGAIIYYTTNGTLPTTNSAIYSKPLTVSATTTINALAAAPGDSPSALATGIYTIGSPPATNSVSLATAANVDGIGTNGTAVAGGGIDGSGSAYSATLLGTSLSWSGVSFALGAGALDAVSNTTVTLPAGNFSKLYMLATGVNGNQANQTFIVTYTDGTTTTFTQSLSDWFTPQNYAGESKAATESYRLTASGANDNRTFYLYGYTFALNGAKTVKSFTLPNNRSVVVLAVTLQSTAPVTPVTATVTLNPAPGNYPAAQSVTLSDSTPLAVIYYTTNGTMPTIGSAVYNAALPVSVTTTINAIAVAPGDSASALATGAYTITPPSSSGSVSLAGVANVDAIGNNGAAVASGGIDGGGFAYSETLLGTSLSWSGVSFTLGTAGALDAISSTTLSLPAGNFSNLYMLGSGVNGSQANQTFIVTYTDGTTGTYTQSLSDWFTPQSYAGESKAATDAYRLNASGVTDNRTFYLYGYNFALNGAKTVKSLTLPNNRNVVVLAVTLQSSAPTVSVTATVTLNPAPGNYSAAQSVTLSDTTPLAVIYYTTNGTTPTTNSAIYKTALPVSATTTINAIAVAPGDSASAPAGGTYTISAPSTTTTVNLTSAANVEGIGNNGSAVSGGGMDGNDAAYSETLLGTSLSWSGITFTLAPVGALNAVSNATVSLPAGDFSKLYMLATGVNGNQASQTFLVTYTDGTTSAFTQSLSDWFTPQSYAGESTAANEAYRLNANGSNDNRTFYLYGYSFAINNAKTVQSIALPKNRNVVVLALTLSP